MAIRFALLAAALSSWLPLLLARAGFLRLGEGLLDAGALDASARGNADTLGAFETAAVLQIVGIEWTKPLGATPKPDEFIKVLRPCEDFPLVRTRTRARVVLLGVSYGVGEQRRVGGKVEECCLARFLLNDLSAPCARVVVLGSYFGTVAAPRSALRPSFS